MQYLTKPLSVSRVGIPLLFVFALSINCQNFFGFLYTGVSWFILHTHRWDFHAARNFFPFYTPSSVFQSDFVITFSISISSPLF